MCHYETHCFWAWPKQKERSPLPLTPLIFISPLLLMSAVEATSDFRSDQLVPVGVVRRPVLSIPSPPAIPFVYIPLGLSLPAPHGSSAAPPLLGFVPPQASPKPGTAPPLTFSSAALCRIRCVDFLSVGVANSYMAFGLLS